jgi:hypothetical protein
MCLQFAFLLITRVTTWLRLSRREEAWLTAEILILRHQLAVLQRRQPRGRSSPAVVAGEVLVRVGWLHRAGGQ